MATWLVGLVGQSGPAPNPLPDIVQYGALAFVVVALLFGYLVTKPSVEQERKLHREAIQRLESRLHDSEDRCRRAEQQRDDLLRQVTEALPVMQASTTASNRMIPILEGLIERFNERDTGTRRARRPGS